MVKAERLLINDLVVEVHRKPYRRKLSMILKESGPLRVLTPSSVSMDTIRRFILEKAEWINQNRAQFEEIKKQRQQFLLQKGESLPLLGQNLTIHPVITFLKTPFISTHEDKILFHIPHTSWPGEHEQFSLVDYHHQLRSFYKREAVQFISQRLIDLSQIIGLFPKKVSFREQKTRWGSCSSQGSINLNWRMIVYRKNIIDSIIIHELCHLKYLDHSKNFWNLVESHCPDYKQVSCELKNLQYQTSFLSLDYFR